MDSSGLAVTKGSGGEVKTLNVEERQAIAFDAIDAEQYTNKTSLGMIVLEP